MTDVIDLGQEKKKRSKGKKDETPQLSLTEYMREFCDIVDRAGNAISIPEAQRWPHRTLVVPDTQDIAYADELTGVCRLITRDQLEMDWREWVTSGQAPPQLFYWHALSSKTMQDCIRYFIHKSARRIQPDLIQVGTDNAPCWARVSIDWQKEMIDDGDARIKHFESFTSRCGAGELTVKQWIGSLFFPQADRSQYLWIKGDGEDGKSKVIDMLHKMMGNACRSTIVRVPIDKFWSSCTRNRRLVALPDNNAYNAATSQVFKQLTGENVMEFERKGVDSVEAINCVKLLITSNKKPHITGERSDLRRILLVEVAPLTGDIDPEYPDKLNAEGPAIIAHCMWHYQLHLVQHKMKHFPLIVQDQDLIEATVADYQGDIQALLETYCEVQIGADKLPIHLAHKMPVAQFHRLISSVVKDISTKYRIKEYLECNGIRSKVYKIAGRPVRMMTGLGLRQAGVAAINRHNGEGADLVEVTTVTEPVTEPCTH